MPSAHCSSKKTLSRNGTLLYFYFDQQGGEVPKTIKKINFDFFVDCSIIDAKLILTPAYGT